MTSIINWMKGSIKLTRRKIIFICIIVSVSLLVYMSITQIDFSVSHYFASLSDTPLYRIARVVTQLGSREFLVPFTFGMGLILWLIYRQVLPMIIFIGGTLVSHLLNELIKQIIQRERPSILIEANATGFSFPSGHAMISTVCYGLLLYFLMNRIKKHSFKIILQIVVTGIISVIGLSRIIINVHYFTDVIIGFLFGFFILKSFIKLNQTLE